MCKFSRKAVANQIFFEEKSKEELYQSYNYKSSHPRCSVRKDALRNFTKFTGKHLWQSLACNFIKKETLAQVFPCEFYEISKSTFSTEHLRTTASLIISCQVLNRKSMKNLYLRRYLLVKLVEIIYNGKDLVLENREVKSFSSHA